jgi:hypothetical protein
MALRAAVVPCKLVRNMPAVGATTFEAFLGVLNGVAWGGGKSSAFAHGTEMANQMTVDFDFVHEWWPLLAVRLR